jgi:beta-glucosidase-like glycosyl hydrolase
MKVLPPQICPTLLLLLLSTYGIIAQYVSPPGYTNLTKSAFINSLVSQMTIPEMVMQLFLMFGDSVVGPDSDNSLYDQSLYPAPSDVGIGVIHDWYPLNTSYVNGLQQLNLEKSRLKIPFLHTGECLHGVGSFQQSMFPQSIGMAASWDTDLVHRVGAAIGTEARSIGIHACFSPVLDICQDQRWGRCQEDWGEDHILTSHMGVAYASGLSKDSSWNRPDAVVPVVKHFAAHGAPQGGLNTAPFMGHGNRQVLQQLLTPFKEVIERGGARGVMMAYSEFDDVPASVQPVFYEALEEWGFDGFVISDDTGALATLCF